MIPANPIAETIARLLADNGFYQEQINKNLELISQLEPLAKWSEETDKIQ